MITGDDVITGAAIAKKLGIPGEAILGADFAALPEAERLSRIDTIGVVGRVAPEHKALLVETLRKKGDVVAMTGDGVNDAPAIKAADIGIAMGTGTEVAKNAGRMILSDDNFATIVFAVEQGRKLYDNLMKYVRFILVTLVAFVLTFLGATIFNIAAGQPFTPGQILWINFLIDMPLGIALGFDLETPGLMKRRPRPRDKGIVDIWIIVMSLLTGGFMAACLLGLIQFGTVHENSAVVGATLAITAFAFFRIVCTYESRSMRDSVFHASTFDCQQINLISLGEIVLAFLVTEFDVLQRLLGTTELSGGQWLLAIAPAVALFLLWETGKCIVRFRHKAPAAEASVSLPASVSVPAAAQSDGVGAVNDDGGSQTLRRARSRRRDRPLRDATTRSRASRCGRSTERGAHGRVAARGSRTHGRIRARVACRRRERRRNRRHRTPDPQP